LRFAPLNAAAAVVDGDDGNRVFTGSQQSTSGMFTRPFAPNINHEFLPFLLILNHQIGFSKFILEVGLCTHANSQARTQPIDITRWLAKQPSAVTYCKPPSIVEHRRHIFAFSLKFIMRLAYTHMQIANTKNNHSSLHYLCKPAKPVIITRSFANQPSQLSSQDPLQTSQASHHLKIFANQLHINIKR
jgi:hypothetical protein